MIFNDSQNRPYTHPCHPPGSCGAGQHMRGARLTLPRWSTLSTLDGVPAAARCRHYFAGGRGPRALFGVA